MGGSRIVVEYEMQGATRVTLVGTVRDNMAQARCCSLIACRCFVLTAGRCRLCGAPAPAAAPRGYRWQALRRRPNRACGEAAGSGALTAAAVAAAGAAAAAVATVATAGEVSTQTDWLPTDPTSLERADRDWGTRTCLQLRGDAPCFMLVS